MGTVTAKTIIDRAAILLQDTDNTRWTRAELLDWTNEAQQFVVSVKPGSNTMVANVLLASGTRQSLPIDGASLIDIQRNVSGHAVRIVARDALDSLLPNWHVAKPSNVVKNYVYDPNVPTVFYVYPPSDGTAEVMLNYAASPAAMTLETATLAVNDIYAPAVLNYVVFRAFSKDTDYTSNATAAAAYYKLFQEALSGRQSFEVATDPNLAMAPLTPNVPQTTK